MEKGDRTGLVHALGNQRVYGAKVEHLGPDKHLSALSCGILELQSVRVEGLGSVCFRKPNPTRNCLNPCKTPN